MTTTGVQRSRRNGSTALIDQPAWILVLQQVLMCRASTRLNFGGDRFVIHFRNVQFTKNSFSFSATISKKNVSYPKLQNLSCTEITCTLWAGSLYSYRVDVISLRYWWMKLDRRQQTLSRLEVHSFSCYWQLVLKIFRACARAVLESVLDNTVNIAHSTAQTAPSKKCTEQNLSF